MSALAATAVIGQTPIRTACNESFGEARRVTPGSVGVQCLATGKLVEGKLILDESSFPEGAVVTVLARDDDETFVASPEQEAALQSVIVEAERGDTISSERLLERLRRYG